LVVNTGVDQVRPKFANSPLRDADPFVGFVVSRMVPFISAEIVPPFMDSVGSARMNPLKVNECVYVSSFPNVAGSLTFHRADSSTAPLRISLGFAQQFRAL
jgi:hypothetical protein